jgi:phage baseplate assembly protein W
MSFDLKISGGDLVIDTDADLAIVQDSEKLIQDVLKFLMTPIGSNVFWSWYGSPLAGSMIGSPFDSNFISSMAENQIRSGLETIQSLQKEQATKQIVSPAELLAAIKSVNVVRNQIDPTFFTISLSLLTKNLTIANTTFNVTL